MPGWHVKHSGGEGCKAIEHWEGAGAAEVRLGAAEDANVAGEGRGSMRTRVEVVVRRVVVRVVRGDKWRWRRKSGVVGAGGY